MLNLYKTPSISPMKRIVLYLMVIAVMVTTACKDDEDTRATDVLLNKTTLALEVGEQETLTATVKPDNAAVKTIVWTSSNEFVATVNNGIVTAVAPGTATISGSTSDYWRSGVCTITVGPALTELTLSSTKMNIYTDSPFISDPSEIYGILHATCTPENSRDIEMKWEISDPTVARLNPYGFNNVGNVSCSIHVLAKGTATVTVTATSQKSKLSASCTVTVTDGCPRITMTALKPNVGITMSYNGAYYIDWGDGTVVDGKAVMYGGGPFGHYYSGAAPYTVTVFGSITHFHCHGNQVTALDVSNFPRLEMLWCSSNPLKKLDVSKNNKLVTLFCSYNELTDLDISANTDLKWLVCDDNLLTKLDVSPHTALTQLDCGYNQLKSLDVSKNTALTELNCTDNLLKSLDVSNNTGLTRLQCGENQLTNLSVSKQPKLSFLVCTNNQMSTAELDALFRTLHSNTISGGKAIHVGGNPGTAGCDKSIAENKGWTVYTN